MVDIDWKTKMVSADIPNKSPTRLSNKLQISIPKPQLQVSEMSSASESACSAYEHYTRLRELKRLWDSTEFPSWKDESVLKPALMGLEITFRFIWTALSDPRPYANRREWRRRLEALTTSQLEVIAGLCEDGEGTNDGIPLVDLTSSAGKVSGASLLPRLTGWKKTAEVGRKIQYSIECEMQRCPYTLGLGEPNLNGKPRLDYDVVCKPMKLNSLQDCPIDLNNFENQTVYAVHQILESWIQVSKQVLQRISERIDSKDYENASNYCWALEKIWNLMNQIESLHLLTDPDDFLRLKNQLSIKSTSESETFCFRSRALVEITKLSKDLRHRVPTVLGVDVDPTGGPRIQNAAMNLYCKKEEFDKIHLLQAMQAVETAVKRFYFSYKQLIVAVMGSLEARGNRAFADVVYSGDSLGRIFLEPTYFPSLDAAKTFLGEYRSHHCK